MTFGGNIKQRACLWAAAAAYVLTLGFGLSYILGRRPTDQAVMLLGFASALIFSAGVWALGLEKRPANPEEEDWQDAVK